MNILCLRFCQRGFLRNTKSFFNDAFDMLFILYCDYAIHFILRFVLHPSVVYDLPPVSSYLLLLICSPACAVSLSTLNSVVRSFVSDSYSNEKGW